MRDRKVLVVEEDPGISTLLDELLADAGFVVLHAGRGQQAARLAELHAPSVILVNYVLPDMSGLDLLDMLRHVEATRHTPVVLVSGRVRQPDGGEPKADCVLPMPFDIGVLLTHVEQLASQAATPVA